MSKLVDEGLAAVETKMADVVSTDVDVLQEFSHQIVGSGRERIRSRLVLLAYLTAGGQDITKVIRLAAAVELVHAATRVHDDINDYSHAQQGKVTTEARWERVVILLTGDYFFAKVYELMAPYGAPYNMIMANACTKLVEGETLQTDAAKASMIDQDTYRMIIARKTASLFEAAARMGAALASGDEDLVSALREYAYNLGLAFQIMATVSSNFGDQLAPGKTIDSNLAPNGKRLSGGIITTEAEVDLIKEMKTRLQDSGTVEPAVSRALEFAQRAREALIRVAESPFRTELEQLVDSVFESTL
jgi:geranylgeranyl pyrophosphate synthase